MIQVLFTLSQYEYQYVKSHINLEKSRVFHAIRSQDTENRSGCALKCFQYPL